MVRGCGLALAGILALVLSTGANAGAVLQRIAAKGVLNVCTNVENRPFAYLSPNGEARGFNIDLAEDIRQRLSLELGQPLKRETIATSGANRVVFLDQGKCDLIITGFSVTAERRRLVDFIAPNFYSSGAVLLARSDKAPTSWESLRGQAVCSSHGSTYNQAVAERYGVRILAFAGLTESAQAMRDGRCVGQVMDEAVARLRLKDSTQWADFSIVLPPILEAPWSMAIAHGDPELRALLNGYARQWRSEGLLERLETRYGLPHKPVLQASDEQRGGLDDQGVPRVLHRVTEAFQQLYQRTGWNFTVFYDSWSAGLFFGGMLTTLALALLCMAVSCVIGLAGALATRGPRPLRWLVLGYVELLRNTPTLVQLYFLYFGVGTLLRSASPGAPAPWYADAFPLAALCISLHYGAFAVEVFRAGFHAVPQATREAALSLGYGRWGRLRHVELPLALRASLPALGNNLVQLIKGTSIAYAVAVPEVLYSAQEIWSDRNNVLEMMLLVLLTYLGFMALLVVGLSRLERRLKLPGVGL
ncbi:MAG TPA: ABC transporter substrate-binding protein/permease [Roseateles sp.]|uniref:ABC transporter substrate-binding protein/permease n=1 Tax=Roseateles sp. TaxID=1971397 RepID=UPI002EDB8156